MRAEADGNAPSCLFHQLDYGTNRITPPSLYSLKQKVQWDEPDEIQVLETENFRVFMGKHEEALAARIAEIAEQWYPRLETRMGILYDSLATGLEKIPLVGYTSSTRFQVTNTSPGIVGEGTQGFFDLIRGRIVFPFTGSNELLSHVIQHELVHAFTFRLLETSWEEYGEERTIAKERRRAWTQLAYAAKLLTQVAPRDDFPRFVRARLHVDEADVGLPPPAYGEGRLHPQIFLGIENDAGRHPQYRISIRLRGEEEWQSLGNLPAAVRQKLAALLPARPFETTLSCTERAYPWIVEGERTALFERAFDGTSLGRGLHLQSALRAGHERNIPAPGDTLWASSTSRFDLVTLRNVPEHEFAAAYDALAPLYHALAALPYDGPIRDEFREENTRDDRFGRAEESLYRWVPPDLQPHLFPLFVMEGVAEYYSSEWNDLNDIVLRDLVIHDEVVPMQYLSGRHGYLVYVQGKSFFQYLGSTYGDERVGLFLRSAFRGRNTSRIFEGIFGKPLDELGEDWERYIRRRYLTELAGQLEIEEYGVAVTDGVFDGPPATANGRVLYTGYHRGRGTLFLKQGKKRTVLARDGMPGTESLHLGKPTAALSNHTAAWVVLDRGRDEIRIADVGTPDAAKHLESVRFDSVLTIESLALSPSGDSIVFAGLQEYGRSDLFVYDRGNAHLERVTRDHVHEKDLSWTKYGILYAADRTVEGRYELMRYRPGSNREPTPVLAVDGSAENPREDDRAVYFIHRTTGGSRNVYAQSKVDARIRAVTRDAIGIKAFDIEHDSLYVLTNQKLKFHIYRTALADTAQALAPEQSTTPLLSPDTTEIAALPPAPGEVWKLPTSRNYETMPYKHEYGPDVFFITGSAFYQQSFLGLSDLLGGRKMAFFLGSNADETADFFKFLSAGANLYFLESRNDYQVGVFRFANDFLTDDQGFFFREEIGVIGGITHPIDRYRSVGGNLELKYVNEEPVVGGDTKQFGETTIEGILGYDTTVPGPFGYGFGSGVLASLIFSVDVEWIPEQSVRSGTALGDLRLYYPLWGRWVWASRFSGGYSAGDFPREIVIGGSLTLRGYDFLSLEGNQYYLANHEVRFPFPVRLLLGGYDLLSPLQGALFVDTGDAWFRRQTPLFQGSSGFGLRAGFGGAVVRWDLARRFREDKWLKGWESDFFFGWNF